MSAEGCRPGVNELSWQRWSQVILYVCNMAVRTNGNWERLQRLRRWPASSSLEPVILRQGEAKVAWERRGL